MSAASVPDSASLRVPLARSIHCPHCHHTVELVRDQSEAVLCPGQLGQQEKSQATRARLRNIAQKPEWARDEEASGFLREAEALLQNR